MSLSEKRLAEIGERLSSITPKTSGVFGMDLLAMSDDLLDEVTRLRHGVEPALYRAWDEGNAVGLDGWIGPKRSEGPDNYAIYARNRYVPEAADRLLNPTDGNSCEGGNCAGPGCYGCRDTTTEGDGS